MQNITSKEQLKEVLRLHGDRVKRLMPSCNNEEQTKISLINPYLEHLGWDVRDPDVCKMEFSADYDGAKNPQRVDYAILHEGKILMLIEAKSASSSLPTEVPRQLQHYFQTQQAKYAILTNGVFWHWYAQDPNGFPGKLAAQPFLIDDARQILDNEADWLFNVHPDRLNHNELEQKAKQSGAQTKIMEWFQKNLQEPDKELVAFLIRHLGLMKTASEKSIGIMSDPVRKGLNQVIGDRIDNSLNRARQEPEDAPSVPLEALKQPEPQRTPVQMPYVDDWVSLQQWELFYPGDETGGKAPRVHMEFRLPNGTITECRGFGQVSKMIIDWVDAHTPGIPHTHEARLVTLPNSQRMFGNFEPKNRVGTDFRNPYEAKRMGIHFEFNHTAENIVQGTLAFLEKFQVDPQQFFLRSQRKSQT